MQVFKKPIGRPEGTATQLELAMITLKGLLEEGPRSIAEIKVAVGRRKLGWRTVEKAKAKLQVIVQREKGLWFWRLPGVAATDALSTTQEVATKQAEERAAEDEMLAPYQSGPEITALQESLRRPPPKVRKFWLEPDPEAFLNSLSTYSEVNDQQIMYRAEVENCDENLIVMCRRIKKTKISKQGPAESEAAVKDVEF